MWWSLLYVDLHVLIILLQSPYTRMSSEDIQKYIGFCMGVLVHGFCLFKLFPIGSIGLNDLSVNTIPNGS